MKSTDRFRPWRKAEYIICGLGLMVFLFSVPSPSAQPAIPDVDAAASVSDSLVGTDNADSTVSTDSTASIDSMEADTTTASEDTTTVHAQQVAPVLPLSNAQEKLVLACENYVQLFPKSDRTPQILDIEAEVYCKVRDYASVVPICQRILEAFPESDYREKSFKRLILAYWEMGQYDEVEQWGEKVQALNVSEELKQFGRESALNAMIERAKALDRTDPAMAAREYERIAQKQRDPEEAALALFNAADRYMRAEMWEEAADTYRRSAAIYPDADLADDALSNAAAIYKDRLENWELAAEVYEELVKSYPQSDYQETSLKNLNFAYTERLKDWEKAVQINKLYVTKYAGTEEALSYEFETAALYLKMGQTDQAMEAYREFIVHHPMDPRTVQARYGLGDLFFEQREASLAKEEFYKALKINDAIKAEGGEGADFYALQAAQRIAEMDFQTYQAFVFERPDLEQDTDHKKTLLEDVLSSYGRVNDFPDPEKQLEAVYKMGWAYELFADAYLTRARPPQLDEVETERTRAVHFAALELLDRARQTYQSNISRYEEAADALDTLGVEWVARCREQLAKIPEKEVEAVFRVGQTYEAFADTCAAQEPPADLSALEQVQFSMDANYTAIAYLDKAAEAYQRNIDQYGEYVAPSEVLKEHVAVAPSDTLGEYIAPSEPLDMMARWLKQSRERLTSIPEQKLALQVEHQRAYVASFVDFIIREKWEGYLQNPKLKPMFADMLANRFEFQKRLIETNLPKIYDDIVPMYEEVLDRARQIDVEPAWLDRLTQDLIWVYDIKGRIYDQVSEEIAVEFVEKEKRCEAFFKSGEVSALGNDYLGLYDLLSSFAYDYLSAYAAEAIEYHRETLAYAEAQGIQSDYLDSLRIEQMDRLYRLALRYQLLLQLIKEKKERYRTLADQGDPDYEDISYVYEDLSAALTDNASVLYERNLELAEEYGGEIGARYRKESEDGLCHIDPERCPVELQTLEMVTDETWLVSNVEEDEWTTLDFSDAHWVPASHGAIPEGMIIPNLEDLVGRDIWDAGSDTVFFRRRFDLPGVPKKATIAVGAHDKYALYVNGLLVERDTQEGVLRDLIALGVPLSKGENLIAVEAHNFYGGADTTGYVEDADTTGYTGDADTTEYVSDTDTTGYGLLCRLTVEMFVLKEEVAPTGVPQEYLQLATTESLLSPADSLFMATLKPSEREAFVNYKMAEANAQIETAMIQANIDWLKRALRRTNAEIKRIEVQLDTWNWIIEREGE